MNIQAIYTEKNNCQDCYKCIRQCPVKAIKMENHTASIISNLCIECGHCILTCPVGTKRFRDDTKAAKILINSDFKVIASLAPSYTSEYNTYQKASLIAALKALGFWKVSETGLGADLYNQEATKFLNTKPKGLYVSSCCPSVVNLVKKYYPQHLDKILPIRSPMHMHAQFLKETYGKNTKIIFIGPCISKKTEAIEKAASIDTVLTFEELNNWLESEGINLKQQETKDTDIFEPFEAKLGGLYPIDGGLSQGIKEKMNHQNFRTLAFSDVNTIKDIFQKIENEIEPDLCLLELMACNGGCVNGPTTIKNKSLVSKIIDTHTHLNLSEQAKEFSLLHPEEIALIHSHSSLKAVSQNKEKANEIDFENDIEEALKSIGKTTEKDHLNCSGCGYETCRNFAKALILEKAERCMCVSYMRRVANNKASVLLQKMPYGVFMVDEKLKIIESNYNFAKILGKEVEELFKNIPGLEGAYLDLLLPSQKLFYNFLCSGEESLEKDIVINKKRIHLSIFSIQKHKILCGIIQNLNTNEIIDNEVIKRTKAVIQENLSTVQKVAFLLGENASKTEVMLNSIIDSQSKEKSYE